MVIGAIISFVLSILKFAFGIILGFFKFFMMFFKKVEFFFRSFAMTLFVPLIFHLLGFGDLMITAGALMGLAIDIPGFIVNLAVVKSE